MASAVQNTVEIQYVNSFLWDGALLKMLRGYLDGLQPEAREHALQDALQQLEQKIASPSVSALETRKWTDLYGFILGSRSLYAGSSQILMGLND